MRSYRPDNPLIVQGDRTVLVEVDNPLYTEARDALARFAELEKSPEYVHTYRITPLSLWNAAAAGLTAEQILNDLERLSKYPLPENVKVDIREAIGRYGRVKLFVADGHMLLSTEDAALAEELSRHRLLVPFLQRRLSATHFEIDPAHRGHVKRLLVQVGYPAEDLAGYVDGAPLSFQLREVTLSGQRFQLRRYQAEAAEIFWAQGSAAGGSGVIVLPCGAGKTIVGMAVMAKAQCATLILTPNTVAVRQWIRELLDKTTLTEDQVGEYSGLKKTVCPVTICTYQVLTYHPRRRAGAVSARGRRAAPALEEYPHMALFNSLNWGLIIYDEVHLLPAPIFRITAELQAKRRLGLTATLVREDGMEGDVFSLVGPKKYDVPWKELEQQGWIATAECHEIRVGMSEEDRMEYAVMDHELKYHFAAVNERKLSIVSMLLEKHKEDAVLIIGQYVPQLATIAQRIGAPLITGETPVRQRERLLEQFRRGEISRLVLSKVGNFSIDLPDANVLIQVSGMFGSRQEEAQRLGRVLRPKRNGLLAHFYTIVTRDTVDQEYAAHRQLFLTEQGYHYNILYEEEVPAFTPAVIAERATQPSRGRLPSA
ncbi:MAG: helicase-associated domain-containing protein [Thermoflexales bacterium]|nr:helicase-associated domain-containing protein [Thermoflexales bacterium]MCX7939561.1 helicase-associated domain-containing protein [Thermoflexales bacterium]MDW8053330.1 helicase-associated domain-containing protein [Anaerolineae bacterium]